MLRTWYECIRKQAAKQKRGGKASVIRQLGGKRERKDRVKERDDVII